MVDGHDRQQSPSQSRATLRFCNAVEAAEFFNTTSYHLAFLLSIASYLVGCLAFWLLRRPLVRPGQAG